MRENDGWPDLRCVTWEDPGRKMDYYVHANAEFWLMVWKFHSGEYEPRHKDSTLRGAQCWLSRRPR